MGQDPELVAQLGGAGLLDAVVVHPASAPASASKEMPATAIVRTKLTFAVRP
jgi:hypothetical protein